MARPSPLPFVAKPLFSHLYADLGVSSGLTVDDHNDSLILGFIVSEVRVEARKTIPAPVALDQECYHNLPY